MKQGTVLGPMLSSASIGECCTEQKNGGACVGTISITSLACADDLIGLSIKLETSMGHIQWSHLF